ncbi:hypothetical protein JCM3774_000851 [Rhodotorula dairenensis]
MVFSPARTLEIELQMAASADTRPHLMPKSTYKFNVVMTCSGCSGAIDRVLKKTEGVTSHDISLEKQEVLVKATIPYDDVLAKIKKTGKEVKSGVVVN